MDWLTEKTHTIPTIFVVDADASVRESLGTLIRSAGWQAICVRSIEQLLLFPPLTGPHGLVLDLALPEFNRPDLDKIITQRPETPVVCITKHVDVALAVRAIRAGAVEFLIKPVGPDAMLLALTEALARSRWELARDTELRALRKRFGLLSGRERDVLALVVEGHLNKQIAAALGIAECTVKVHRGRVMHKMAARSLADLIKMSGRLHVSRQRGNPHSQWQEYLVPAIPIRRDGPAWFSDAINHRANAHAHNP
jgi:FixJ family two-component response regulator